MRISMIGGTLAILVTQLGVIAMLTGIGLVIRRRFGLRVEAARDLLLAFWVGLAAALLFLLAWTFAFPVNAGALALVAAAGLAGLAAAASDLRALPGRDPPSFRPVALVLVALGSLWVANLGRGPLTNTDTLLYHLQGVRWANAFATVPGLANLFGPLGFNNASLLFDALLEVGPWAGRAHHVANGVLIQVLLWQGLLGLAQLVRGAPGGSARAQAVFDAVLIAPAVNMAIQDWLRSFVTDLPASAVVLVAASEAHRLLLDRARPAEERAYSVVVVATLLALAVTFKLSLIVFGGLTGLLVLGALLRPGLPAGQRNRALAWAAAGALAIGVTWAGRGVVLSGYPLFPTPRFGFPVDWRVPVEHAIGEFGYAAESARASTSQPAGVLHQEPFGVWFQRWWELSGSDDLHHLVVPGVFALLAMAAALALRARGRREPTPSTWLLLAPALVALVLWFRVAPEPRYAAPLIWTVFGVSAAALFRTAGADGTVALRRAGVALAVLGASPAVMRPLVTPGPDTRNLPPLQRLVEENLRLRGRGRALYRDPPPPQTRRYVTASGLELNASDRRCGFAPLPCTPNPAPNLRLRVPGRLDGGFAVDGRWQMLNWPAGRPTFGRAWAERRRLERASGGP